MFVVLMLIGIFVLLFVVLCVYEWKKREDGVEEIYCAATFAVRRGDEWRITTFFNDMLI